MNLLQRLRGRDSVEALDVPILGLVLTGLLTVLLLVVIA